MRGVVAVVCQDLPPISPCGGLQLCLGRVKGHAAHVAAPPLQIVALDQAGPQQPLVGGGWGGKLGRVSILLRSTPQKGCDLGCAPPSKIDPILHSDPRIPLRHTPIHHPPDPI